MKIMIEIKKEKKNCEIGIKRWIRQKLTKTVK